MIAPVGRADDRGGLDYLGPEFLTWLWWRSEEDPRFVRPDGTELFLHVDEHLEFRGERAASRRTTLRAGAPSASMEARAALKSGKLLVAARLLMARGDEEVAFTLRAEDLDVTGLKLPAPGDDAKNPRERLAASLEAFDRFWDDLDHCFATFLEVRTSDAWDDEVRRFRTWSARPSQDEGGLGRLRDTAPPPRE
jgi:hypothetical protein